MSPVIHFATGNPVSIGGDLGEMGGVLGACSLAALVRLDGTLSFINNYNRHAQ
jgi:hypothetical protein